MFCPPSDFTGGGGKTTPLFYMIRSSVITLLVYKTCLYSFWLRCLYILNRGVEASRANLLKNALHLGQLARTRFEALMHLLHFSLHDFHDSCDFHDSHDFHDSRDFHDSYDLQESRILRDFVDS